MADDILKFRAGDLKGAVLELAAENDVTLSAFLREAVEDKIAALKTECDSCGQCDVCGLEQINPDEYETLDTASPSAAIWGYGEWSTTTNPDVAALIERAKELLAEGAVGVSIATDLNPADLPANPNDATDEILEAAHIRPRHVAIVDTPAFSGAYLAVQDDGTLAGPIVFEGVPTGDLRGLPFESLEWDDDLLPIPIIIDLAEGDHTGTVVGMVNRLERVTGEQVTEAADVVPIAASAHAYPAALFDEPAHDAMTLENIGGYTRYSGAILPAGVCHRGKPGCYTYRSGSADLSSFHSGARVQLDNGDTIRVGRIVAGGLHADANKMDYAEAVARTDDNRRAIAMGRVFDTPRGLLFSGVLLPDVDRMRVEASAPSVELWPGKSGRLELKTALLVNDAGWPVAASTGHSLIVSEPAPERTRLVRVRADGTEELLGFAPPEYGKATVAVEPDGALEKRLTELENVVGELYAVHLASQFDAN